eukprot:TRINITY_DN12831_c0_g1_i1.p1 TRINITY_DN12831_c0_g1~~TRINITY_DN12831_c0_g1_i1.p1  ORF type:complete len:344 (+),score=65.62 TRINITY_DN12831_c0_g1_i1:158-1189(+)
MCIRDRYQRRVHGVEVVEQKRKNLVENSLFATKKYYQTEYELYVSVPSGLKKQFENEEVSVDQYTGILKQLIDKDYKLIKYYKDNHIDSYMQFVLAKRKITMDHLKQDFQIEYGESAILIFQNNSPVNQKLQQQQQKLEQKSQFVPKSEPQQQQQNTQFHSEMEIKQQEHSQQQQEQHQQSQHMPNTQSELESIPILDHSENALCVQKIKGAKPETYPQGIDLENLLNPENPEKFTCLSFLQAFSQVIEKKIPQLEASKQEKQKGFAIMLRDKCVQTLKIFHQKMTEGKLTKEKYVQYLKQRESVDVSLSEFYKKLGLDDWCKFVQIRIKHNQLDQKKYSSTQ